MTCPLCGRYLELYGCSLAFHTGPDGSPCWVSGLGTDEARWTASALKADPRLPERAHP